MSSLKIIPKPKVRQPSESGGWSPQLAVEHDGARRVLRVVDWFGGYYDKPDVGLYIGPLGFVATAAEAEDLSSSVIGGGSAAWVDITGKPSTFPPSVHTHVTADVTGLDTALSGKQPLAAALTATTAAFTTAQETKLAGIATAATANASDAALRDRATHTGTQAAGTITGLATIATSGAYSDLSGIPSTFAPSAHTHAIADVTGLQTALDSKGPLVTFRQSRHVFNEFLSTTAATGWVPWVGLATSGAAVAGATINGAPDQGQLRITAHNTNANSAYSIKTTNTFRVVENLYCFVSVYTPPNLTSIHWFLGFHSSQTITAPINGVFFRLNAGLFSLETRSVANGSTTHGTTLAASTSTQYWFLLERTASGVRGRIFDATFAVLYDQTVTTTLPTESETVTHGFVGAKATAGNLTIAWVNYTSFGIQKPAFLP